MTAWDLSGRRALVTGAAQGIGAGIAAALRAAGARVTGLDRRAGPDCIGCDLADPGQIGPAVDRAAEVLGGIDILVNNAGINEKRGLAEIDLLRQFKRIDELLAALIKFGQPLRARRIASLCVTCFCARAGAI